MMHDLVLDGAISTLLAGYLKALAIHRIVSDQCDREAMSFWDDDGRFHLVSSLDHDALAGFFMDQYAPTPVVTPWNGGSGFYPTDQHAGVDAIERSESPRFHAYRATLQTCRGLLRELGIVERPKDELKQKLLEQARARLPDETLRWLDAVVVVGDSPAYPAILGTGGNDGRLDFANNFMQRVAELFITPVRRRRGDTTAGAAEKLRASLFGQAVRGVYQDAAVGQFAPALAGGTNMADGFGAESRVNPWDFVLAIEGALLFAGAAVRRLDSAQQRGSAFPFHVAMSPVGYGSSASSDGGTARAELWLPLWPAPATLAELEMFFGEGRLQIGRRRAASGLDAARALTTLGVDRGIDRFERLGILQRNGLSFLATSQGTLHVRAIPEIDRLRELDGFISAVDRLDKPTPSISAASRALQTAMFDACRSGGSLADVLAATGALERAIGRSPKSRDKVRPLRRLSAHWHAVADDGSDEFAVASAVASWGIRQQIEPVDEHGRWDLAVRPMWSDRDPFDNIVAIASHRLRVCEESGKVPLRGRSVISSGVLKRLLGGSLDPRRLADLIFGLSLVERPDPGPREVCTRQEPAVAGDGIFGILRAVTSPDFLAEERMQGGVPVRAHPAPKVIPMILAQLGARDVGRALEIAKHRLVASRHALRAPIDRAVGGRTNFPALAAALVIPLGADVERAWIHPFVIKPSNHEFRAEEPR